MTNEYKPDYCPTFGEMFFEYVPNDKPINSLFSGYCRFLTSRALMDYWLSFFQEDCKAERGAFFKSLEDITKVPAHIWETMCENRRDFLKQQEDKEDEL